ncbi:MAG: hypothetical protein HC875_01500 [Anaerolineales bacterium]|nr:hypothetical protein [Anaerolineales bacterium]
MNEDQRQKLITNEFFKRFNQAPTEWVRAPGRVDLMGSHTDYNQGYVMTMAINRDTWLAARPRSDRNVVIYSLNLTGEGKFNLDHIVHDTTPPGPIMCVAWPKSSRQPVIRCLVLMA